MHTRTRTRTHTHTHTHSLTHSHLLTHTHTHAHTHTPPERYPRLIEKLRILLFSGDVDERVPYNGAEQWTRGFGYDEAAHWHPWVVDNSVAGYATVYDTPHNFTWATVRGAGHMAPLFQPLRLLNLFDRFIHRKPL